ncbi:MAG: hypothetical protein JST32_06010 [Bacteroidetes bacterium]|nr:hypothetical protein [Bacteroidota bacterium]
MKKLMILLGILFSVKTVFAQGFKPVKIDSLVTVSMPATYTQKDTLGQHIYSANTDMGYIVTMVEPNAKGNQPLKKENDLNSVLKKYIQGIQRQSGNGSAQFVRDTTVGTLKAKAFTLVTDNGTGDVENRDFLLIYTTDATYTFQYGYPDTRKDYVKDERKAFFSSIRLSPQLQRNDQYTETSSSGSGVSTYSVIEIAGGAIVVFVVIWLLFFRPRKNELA